MSDYRTMPEYRGLLAAVKATPADDLPRLVLADWLEENASDVLCLLCGGRKWHTTRTRTAEMGQDEYGESSGSCHQCNATGRVTDGRREHAEFIRVQIELARGRVCRVAPTPCERCADCTRRHANQRREGEVWRAIRDGLAVPLPGCQHAADNPGCVIDTAEGLVYTVRRGFVDEVRGPLAAMVGVLPAVVREHPVVRVEVTDRKPMENMANTFVWFIDELEIGPLAARIPADLFTALERVADDLGANVLEFPTASAARDALSAACIAYAAAQ